MPKTNLKRLGDYIRKVDVRNRDLKVKSLQDVSIQKKFMPSIANTIGADMSTHKVVLKNQFAYGPVTSRNGDKVSVALLTDSENVIISQTYFVFEIIDENKLMPEYLMMYFCRPEFDRYARFHSHGSAREVFDWEEMCNVMLPVPDIEIQRQIIDPYQTLETRIQNNKKLCTTLEQTAQAFYKKMFQEGKSEKSKLGEICKCFLGFPFDSELYSETDGVTALRGENVTEPALRWDTVKKYNAEITDRITKCYLQEWDVVIGMDGSKVGKNWSLVYEYDLPLLLVQRVACLRSNSIEKQVYAYMSLKMNSFAQYVSPVNTGSTILHIRVSQIEDFSVVIPSMEQFDHIKEEMVPLFRSIKYYKRENQLLGKIQTLLLSKIGS